MPGKFILSWQKFGIVMATEHLVQMCVTLRPIGQPWVKVSANSMTKAQQLTDVKDFVFEFAANGSSNLVVEHHNKDVNDVDTAVEIVNVSFFGISDPRFVWAGVYYPDYPKHYPDKTSPLLGHGYLGWNGVYRLEFSVPVFTWIHQIQNLGWLYQ
jgi:hypothetical protein